MPERTLIMGAGYIGLELGQALARLGSTVEIMDFGERPLGRESPEVSAVLKEALERDGFHFRLNTRADEVRFEDGLFRVRTEGGETMEGDRLLAATGRRPNTEALRRMKAKPATEFRPGLHLYAAGNS